MQWLKNVLQPPYSSSTTIKKVVPVILCASIPEISQNNGKITLISQLYKSLEILRSQIWNALRVFTKGRKWAQFFFLNCLVISINDFLANNYQNSIKFFYILVIWWKIQRVFRISALAFTPPVGHVKIYFLKIFLSSPHWGSF